MSNTTNLAAVNEAGGKSLIVKFASRYGVQPERMLSTLTATAFKQQGNRAITTEQMVAMLVVADQYKLNPFTKEIYAFADKSGGIVPIVGIDGWIRLMNEHPQFNGMDFTESENREKPEPSAKSCPEWMEITIHRKDRDHPIKVREELDEVYRNSIKKDGREILGPWQTHTKRMLRWKTMIQGARVAFGFAGIYDQDEAERIVEGHVIDGDFETMQDEPKGETASERLKERLRGDGAKEAAEFAEEEVTATDESGAPVDIEEVEEPPKVDDIPGVTKASDLPKGKKGAAKKPQEQTTEEWLGENAEKQNE